MDHELIIRRQAQALQSLTVSLPRLFEDAMSSEKLTEIVEKKFFDSAEDESIAYWFARFTTIRRNLWSIVETGIYYTGGMDKLSQSHDYQYFVLGYSAVCSLIRMDRFLLNKVATHTLIQRKLNEAFPNHRIERKQFSEIYQGLVHPHNAIRIHQAHRILKKRKTAINRAVTNSPVENIFERLPQQERYIDLSRKNYLLAWLKSRRLIWRRRGASAKQKSLFTIFEYGGRLAADLALPRPKQVTSAIRSEVEALLQPGDFFITRHSHALTNLFLPGFWPHAALYLGTPQDRKRLGISAIPTKLVNASKYWVKQNCVLEAQKDGVHFRPLSETLRVDAFVVVRPNFSNAEKKDAILRVIEHAGKAYNFDFDFFRSDQLVCTEVIYRAYDGIGGFNIPLKERIGRKTLSAEDLLDLALNSDWADPIAIFGIGDNRRALQTGNNVTEILRGSYSSQHPHF